ncbi:MAG: hypothetical protein ACSLEM_01665 [Candidatus Malihini olakiniferum]
MKYKDELIFCLMMLLLMLLFVGLFRKLLIMWRKKRADNAEKGTNVLFAGFI